MSGVRMTEEWLEQYRKRQESWAGKPPLRASPAPMRPEPPRTEPARPERRPTGSTPGTHGPNKTEARFNREVLGGRGMYEAVTFRLPGGSRYTPDFVVFDDQGLMLCYEVKGSYRFGSEGRALTAFRECRAAFPLVTFMWFKYDQKARKWLEKHQP